MCSVLPASNIDMSPECHRKKVADKEDSTQTGILWNDVMFVMRGGGNDWSIAQSLVLLWLSY